MKTIFLLLCIILMSGCVTTPQDPHQQIISTLDDHVYALSAAIDVVTDSLPEDAIDEAIISAATAKDAALRASFDGYSLKTRIEDGYGVLIVCDKNKKSAYIEDISCTSRVDTLRPTGSPCEYFLDVKRVCSAP